jgi:hypothetical protein
MRRFATILIAAACLVGCQRDFHDPILRQQLTVMITESGYPAAKKNVEDLDVMLSVNSARMSEQQKLKLTAARDTLKQAVDVYYTDLPVYFKKVAEGKKIITEAAGTF